MLPFDVHCYILSLPHRCTLMRKTKHFPFVSSCLCLLFMSSLHTWNGAVTFGKYVSLGLTHIKSESQRVCGEFCHQKDEDELPVPNSMGYAGGETANEEFWKGVSPATPHANSVSKMPLRLHIVVAHCLTSVDWLDEIVSNPMFQAVSITILSKCGAAVDYVSDITRVIRLLNVGRCEHAYIYWMLHIMDSDVDVHKHDAVLFTEDNFGEDHNKESGLGKRRNVTEMGAIVTRRGFACGLELGNIFYKGSDGRSKPYVVSRSTYSDCQELRNFEIKRHVTKNEHAYANLFQGQNNSLVPFKLGNRTLGDWYDELVGGDDQSRLPCPFVETCYGGVFMVLGRNIRRSKGDVIWRVMEIASSRGDNIEETHFIERLLPGLLAEPLSANAVILLRNHSNAGPLSLQGSTHGVLGKIFTVPVAKRDKIPSFLIIGTQKGGTEALSYYLKKHPSINGTEMSEAHFFDSPVFSFGREAQILDMDRALSQSEILRLRAAYKDIFVRTEETAPLGNSSSSLYFFEKTPSYLFMAHLTAPRIRQVIPWVKIVVSLRDPLERAFSHYLMDYERNSDMQQNNVTFEECIEKDMHLLEEANVLKMQPLRTSWKTYLSLMSFTDARAHTHCEGIIGRGLYVFQLRLWFELYPEPSSSFHVIKAEEMRNVSRMGTILEETFHWLDIPTADVTIGKSEHLIHSTVKHAAISEMTNITRRRLQDFFKPYNELLYAELRQHDLSIQHWNY